MTHATDPRPPDAIHPSSLFKAVQVALLCLLVSLVVHCPRLWILAQPVPGSTYWDRGLQFMQQVEQPLGSEIRDAGLVWRLAPVLLAKALGLQGAAVFAVPWMGLLALLTYTAHLARRRTGDPWVAFWATLLMSTTSATLTVTGWMGFNDAWYALALLVTAFHAHPLAIASALLAGPWVDERFVLALPLALWVRLGLGGCDAAPRFTLGSAVATLAFYLGMRGLNPLGLGEGSLESYRGHIFGGLCLAWLPWSNLGLFMGLRAAWVLVFWALIRASGGFSFKQHLPTLVLAILPVGVIHMVAADTGRSTTMLLPLLIAGLANLWRLKGRDGSRRWMAILALANLVMPAMHVTHKHGDVINCLPIELARLFIHHF